MPTAGAEDCTCPADMPRDAPRAASCSPSHALSAIEQVDALSLAVQHEVSLAVLLNEGTRDQRHHSNSQQLQQRVPREDGIQRGDLGEDGASLHADEVIGHETWEIVGGEKA